MSQLLLKQNNDVLARQLCAGGLLDRAPHRAGKIVECAFTSAA
jgi:hypothetical protein